MNREIRKLSLKYATCKKKEEEMLSLVIGSCMAIEQIVAPYRQTSVVNSNATQVVSRIFQLQTGASWTIRVLITLIVEIQM